MRRERARPRRKDRGRHLWRRCLAVALIALVLSLCPPAPATAVEAVQKDLTEVSLEELMRITVTSVSRKPEPLFTAAAAVYVITQDDIRRSGVTSLPEALRMAPGVHVARINANQWAIGIRGSTSGFTSRLSRSVLVLIDGRSVYSPLFAGVFWEVQDTLLEDIDRIEVIRGPGGTLWGANAFAGVINIITKRASETQGVLATLGGGTEERAFGALRYGGTVGEDFSYRVYGKAFDRDDAFHPDGGDFDDWRMGQVGFRTDWDGGGADRITFQGDLYGGRIGERVTVSTFTSPFSEVREEDTQVSGGNVLGRWQHALGPTSYTTFQAYYDRTSRRQADSRDRRDTVDLDFRYHFELPRQEIAWGLGYRFSSGGTDTAPTVEIEPSRRSEDLFSALLQDEITILTDRLRLTVGSKFEHNDFSGFEVQPSARLLFTPHPRHALWASVSRAVRTPSRFEQDFTITSSLSSTLPIFARFGDDPGKFDSEHLVAYELGYRVQPVDQVFVDVALFYNRFTDLLSLEVGVPFVEPSPPPGHVVLPIVFANKMGGEAYGGEIATEWRPFGWWRLGLNYAYQQLDVKRDADSTDVLSEQSTEGTNPRHEVSARSFVDLPWRLEANAVFRYVSRLANLDVGDYFGLDAGVTWQAAPGLDLSVVGQNLLEHRHVEFRSGDVITEIERGVYGKVTWLW